MSGVGALFGKTVDGWRNEYLAERDAVLRHYICLHPADFPLPSMFIELLVYIEGISKFIHLTIRLGLVNLQIMQSISIVNNVYTLIT